MCVCVCSCVGLCALMSGSSKVPQLVLCLVAPLATRFLSGLEAQLDCYVWEGNQNHQV